MKTFVYAVPDGIPAGGQILVTVYETAELEEVAKVAGPGDWKPEDRYEVATRGPIGFGIRVWSPPLDLEARG